MGSVVLRVVADRSKCCGYGLCAQMCPQVFKLDEGGLVYLESDVVPAGLEEEAREFRTFLNGLRGAADAADFEAFLKTSGEGKSAVS